MEHPILPPESAFSRAVFQEIRPHIPKERWPLGSVKARFSVAEDGLHLTCVFDDLPANYAAVASEYVRLARVGLVLKSPAALIAREYVRIKRWRDTFLFAFVPLLFGIPLMGILGEPPMRIAAACFCMNVVALILSQTMLMKQRRILKEVGFIAHIPSPGMRLGARNSDKLTSLDDSPEL